MKQKLGEKILDYIKVLQSSGIVIDHIMKGMDNIYILKGKDFKMTLTINPIRWLGLEFNLLGETGKKQISYDIDTDNYDITQQKYFSYAEGVEDEIINFLIAAKTGKIMVGYKKNKLTLIIPKNTKYLLITKGKFFTKSEYISELELVKHGDFKKLIID